MTSSRITKLALLITSTLAGGLLNVSCSMGDMRDSMVTGMLGYVKTATTDVLTGLLPVWKDVAKQAAAG